MSIIIPDRVRFILNKLNENGFEAFVVGGCVRDFILGLVPNDWDICTDAQPFQIKKCFESFKTFDSGIRHGTISVAFENEIFEVTTYRIDGNYSDNRRPDSVVFTDDICMDLARRDFTVNAMAYNNESGLVDPFGGQLDLANSVIRCVGDPDKRFNEDALRIIRALRFASVYEFSVEEKTSRSILKNAGLLNNIAAERISDEFIKLLCGKGAEKVLNDYRDVAAVLIEELKSEFDYNQSTPHHNRDLWRHTTFAVGSVQDEPVLRMTMLLHDLGKPLCRITDKTGCSHYRGHPAVSAEMADKILHRLKYSSEFIKTCKLLVKYHDVRFSYNPEVRLLKLLNKIGAENVRLLFSVQRADIAAQSDYKREAKLAIIENAENLYDKIMRENICFSLSGLAVDGNDLINAGIPKGRKTGLILNCLLDMVIEGKIENNKETLICEAEKLIKSQT